MKAVYTICTPSHIAEAQTLISSVSEQSPEAAGIIFLFNADAFAAQSLSSFGTAETIVVDTMQLAHYGEMKARYTAFELSCALKPYLADYLLHERGYEQVIYFDADILVTHPLLPVWESLAEKKLILTGHVNGTAIWEGDDIAVKARRSIERNMLRGGVFNGGFFAVEKSTGTGAFLSWWMRVLLDGCYNKPSKGLFVDQLWLATTPLLFNNLLLISKHPGFNMAYWNLDERKLVKNGDLYDVITSEGIRAPLIFFHFSGFKAEAAGEISVYHPNLYSFASRPELKPLFEDYKSRLLGHGYSSIKARYSKKSLWQRLFSSSGS